MTPWTAVYRMLMGAFLLTAGLNLLHVRAGFLTSHLADLTVPPLIYVICRGLAPGTTRNALLRWLGDTPQRAASLLFLASTATEVSQIYWPRGVFAGRFDPWDIVAYAAGLAAVYAFETREPARSGARGGE